MIAVEGNARNKLVMAAESDTKDRMMEGKTYNRAVRITKETKR